MKKVTLELYNQALQIRFLYMPQDMLSLHLLADYILLKKDPRYYFFKGHKL